MARTASAGLLMYRVKGGVVEVFLAHPGGPFYAKRDEGVWSIPKGEVGEAEGTLAAAIREFTEETGLVSRGEYLPLGTVRLKSGKVVHAWAFRGDQAGTPPIRSNAYQIEWPPRSGRVQEFPEIDRTAFLPFPVARHKIHPSQLPFLARLEEHLAEGSGIRPERS